MVNIVVELSKYLMILLIISYTYQCFTVFGYHNPEKKKRILRRQNWLMFEMHFVANMVLFLKTNELKRICLYLAEAVVLLAAILLYTRIYPMVSRLIVNNMCMLLSIGFIMISRLNFQKAVKQVIIAAGGIAISLAVPVIIRKMRNLASKQMMILYAAVGIAALLSVLVLGVTSDGAKLGFSIGGIGIQPSEFVKIVFVFFVAASLNRSTRFRNVVITTALAAFHVLILVVSRDLGAALIIFVTYLVMLYVATRQPLYMLAGLGAGCAASVAAYYLFAHVRTRVLAWKDPFAIYSDGGYQVAQSLFAIGTGSWFGMGLFQGLADKIPVPDEDFIFSAISEEMGLIFGLCLILICLSCYVMFLNIALQLMDMFYKLVALGLGTCYIFQTFLTIGGVTKFIPSTGVTLPLVSYGGSSVLSTLIMFAIIQGLYILREDEEEDIERRKEQQKLSREKAGVNASRKKESSRPDGKKEAGRVPEQKAGAKRAPQSSGRPARKAYGTPGRSIDEEIGATVQEALRERKSGSESNKKDR
ncbi:MAG TPA: cell division protein FtsW [Lachnospiraceae bacterium]|nr:cell division protein FtsW [Lachnospiraceae bacterium]